MADEDEYLDPEQLRAKLADLQTEHRDLDDAISALLGTGAYDMIRIQRLKKRKLALRDQIARLENQLIPNIIA